ncbi:MAG: hypothetical protein EOR84_32110 [Mesorhizobium sp.]|uniref:hypothetical protein n=1 Tax=Mesorhizobium sp. TaxID=1871066 RepID=UPI000FEA724C|nr:hypothetical protein [Mesorhizobium sp.]RWM85285.1 MAG: hypothetical protein EOR84_32110 [Mesorhizobium sp.]
MTRLAPQPLPEGLRGWQQRHHRGKPRELKGKYIHGRPRAGAYNNGKVIVALKEWNTRRSLSAMRRWQGYSFHAGDWVLLDLYGTDVARRFRSPDLFSPERELAGRLADSISSRKATEMQHSASLSWKSFDCGADEGGDTAAVPRHVL